IDDPDPVLFLEHKKMYRLIKGPLPQEDYRIPLGVARIARAGTDGTLISYGLPLHYCVAAADALADEGIGSLEVIDLRTLQPWDRATVLTSVSKTGRALVVTEDNHSVSVAAEVCATIAEECFFDLDAPVRRLCTADIPSFPFASIMENAALLTEDRVTETARALLQA
ncbi:MAG TPA: transketolase C-terminal domain-containing protein, partial [Acidimicrobiia bacterium]|nr:transketolase C-terminal domain-containing protein [Acidimicrobiia bacterium]